MNVKRKLCPAQINYKCIRAVVIGGSLGGLSSALALRCVNCDVDVFERSRGVMKSRGAGLVVQTELVDFLKRHGIVAEQAISIPASKRQYLSQDGSIDSAMHDVMGHHI